MPRRKDNVTPQDVVAILSRLPFWVGPVLIAAVFAGMRWLLPSWADSDVEQAVKEGGPMNIATPVLLKSVGGASRVLAPFAAGLLGFLWVVAEFVKWQLRRAEHAESAPACPACNSSMTIKTAKRGANSGSQFWSCSRYPDCRGTLPI